MSGARLQGPVAACVFDAYGTLLDVNSAVDRQADAVGPRAAELSALWRRKQLEYTWLRSLMRRHADFRQVTGDALDHAMAALGIGGAALREALLDAYDTLTPYPEVGDTLRALRGRGVRCAVLSNGSPEMLRRGIESAGLAGLVDPVISVEDAGVFKPAPETYMLATRALGVAAGEVAFFSSNAWDVHGSSSFGFQAVWVNRFGAAAERLPGEPALEAADLSDAVRRVGAGA